MKKWILGLLGALLMICVLSFAGCAGRGEEETSQETDLSEPGEEQDLEGEDVKDADSEEDLKESDGSGERADSNEKENPERDEDTKAPGDAKAPGDFPGDGQAAIDLEAPEAVYTTDRVNVRKGMSTESDIFKTVSRRTTMTRTGYSQDKSWSRVTLEGETGTYYVASQYLTTEEPKTSGLLVALDAGHQAKGNSEKEPIGPGAAESKAKVAGGTSGVASGLKEYELTLQVTLQVRDELEARG